MKPAGGMGAFINSLRYENPNLPEEGMDLSRPSTLVLAPNLVLYSDEEVFGPRLKRLIRLIPVRPLERRPPGEPLPLGIRRTFPAGPAMKPRL